MLNNNGQLHFHGKQKWVYYRLRVISCVSDLTETGLLYTPYYRPILQGCTLSVTVSVDSRVDAIDLHCTLMSIASYTLNVSIGVNTSVKN